MKRYLCALGCLFIFCQASALYLARDHAVNLYGFYNKSTEVIWLNHPTSTPVSAGWASLSLPGHYSILLLAKAATPFQLQCTHANGVAIACQYTLCYGRLTVRQLPAAMHMQHSSFWLLENQRFNGMQLQAFQRGVWLWAARFAFASCNT